VERRKWCAVVVVVVRMEGFINFPRTSHIINLGSASRDDLVLDQKDVQRFLDNEIIIEEKVDGANLGISINDQYEIHFQNRSHYVTSESATQWRQLDVWKKQHQEALYSILTPNLILFGEWCYAKHSIHYTLLPDIFLAFDIYDKTQGKFYSVEKRDELLQGTSIKTVPLVARGKFAREQLAHMLNSSPSQYYEGPPEGLYMRIEQNGFLKERGKFVRADFLAHSDDVIHWSKQGVVKNIVNFT